MHPTMDEFIAWLFAEDRSGTAPNARSGLRIFSRYLEDNDLDPLKMTTEQLKAFQRWLAEDYRQANGNQIVASTQAARLIAMKGDYTFLARRGTIRVDPAKRINRPHVPPTMVTSHYLDQQEVIALIQCQAGRVGEQTMGSFEWAIEQRNLALLCLAVATGQRRSTLRSLLVDDLDFRRNEVRIERVKGGKPGRVLPVAKWALDICRDYIRRARPLILGKRRDRGWLFVGEATDQIFPEYLSRMLERLQKQTIDENPDLDELPDKNLTAHSLRVTFATMMFLNGCDIRTINELLLHRRLTTTARYTPLPLEDLRRACRVAHPRA